MACAMVEWKGQMVKIPQLQFLWYHSLLRECATELTDDIQRDKRQSP